MRKVMKARRAISPVISALLLIILTVAAGVVAYAYVMGWLGGTTKASSVEYGELSLDSATATSSDNKVTAYVRNLGGKSVTANRAYVNGANATLSSTAIGVNEVKKLEITASSLDAGVTYEVKIVCTDGTSLVFSVKATS